MLLEIEHFMNDEANVTERCAVGVHGLAFLFVTLTSILRDGRPMYRK